MSILSISGKNGEKTFVIHPHCGDERLSILSCGFTAASDTLHVRRANSSICVFQYIKSGCGYVVVNGSAVKAKAGDVIINHSDTPHEYWSDKSDPWSKIWLNVSGTLVTELLRIYQLQQVEIIPDIPEMEEVFTDCINNLINTPGDITEEAAVALHRIIWRLNKSLAPHSPAEDEIASLLRSRLNAEVVSGKTLCEICETFPISESQLTRRFRSRYGCSPYAYLLDCRIKLAKTMLINTAYPVADIARKCGFDSQYYFSSLFKKKTGVSPSAYRGIPKPELSVPDND